MASRGLPQNPRPRAKSAAAPRTSQRSPVQEYVLPSNPRAPAMASRRTPPVPVRRNDDKANTDNNSRHDLRSSPSTSVSSTSSVWASNLSMASSRTTLSSDGEEGIGQTQKTYSRPVQKNENSFPAGLTWNKVSEVANVVTQEVSRAWTAGFNPITIGVCPDPGKDEESDLTRVMRAYHLSKARTLAELPDWLFSARERGQNSGTIRSEVHHDNASSRTHAGSSASVTISRPFKESHNTGKTPSPAKISGSDRLKMLRDSRRNMDPSTHRI